MATAQGEDNVDFPHFSVTYKAPAGSAVVLDTTNGNVVAMASFPVTTTRRIWAPSTQR